MPRASSPSSQENASRAAIERIRSKHAPSEEVIAKWGEAIVAGDRKMLARGISLVESERPQDRRAAEQLLERLLPFSGKSVRVGVTGVPGAGKSTLIERIGLAWIAKGQRVAVLAVDPSSRRTGGSVLGDKTRMDELARSTEAFVRPSPAGQTLGGVARATGEAIVLCEAAGFDRIVVETVGVGQSETEVRELTDFFVLVLIAGAGDELQGIKRGVLEWADVLLVNKCDGDNVERAKAATARYGRALDMLPPPPSGEACQVIALSALQGDGVPDFLEILREREALLRTSGQYEALRVEQRIGSLNRLVRASALQFLRDRPGFSEGWDRAVIDVKAGRTTPYSAIDRLISGA
jgi:LAO/AO transport system kinase